MPSSNSTRLWTQSEIDFYIEQANQGKTILITLENAVKAGFPVRSKGDVKSKLSKLKTSWSALGGSIPDRYKIRPGNFPKSVKLDTTQSPAPLDIDRTVIYEKKIESLKAERELIQRKYLKVVREQNFQDRVLELIDTGIKAIPYREVELLQPTKSFDPPLIEETMVMFVSDLHAGEIVSPHETMGFGKYDYTIFQRRMEHYVDTVIRFRRDILKTYYYQKLHMFCLGDMVAGIIHEELRESASGSIMQEVVGCVEVMKSVILDLLPYFEEIELDCIVGNHGRLEKQVRFKRKSQDSFDWLVYYLLRKEFQHYSQVVFNISKAPYLLVNVAGYSWLLMHGDTVKGWAGIPFYGVERETKKWGDLFGVKNESFQYVALAHFHTPYTLPRPGGGEVFGNGAVIGPNEFSIAVTSSASPASQKLLSMHASKGVTLAVGIYLQNPPEKPEYRYNFSI